MTPEAAALEDRQHALAEPVCLLQMRIAGEDELGDAGAGVLLDQVGDLLVAADQGGAGAAADEADAGPEVRVDLEVAQAAAVAALVQRAHPLLALRLAGREARLNLGDHVVGDALDQVAGLPPGLLGGVTRDRVQADAEAEVAVLLFG